MSARRILRFEGLPARELLRSTQRRESDFAAVSGDAVGKAVLPSGCIVSSHPQQDDIEYWGRITERATD